MQKRTWWPPTGRRLEVAAVVVEAWPTYVNAECKKIDEISSDEYFDANAKEEFMTTLGMFFGNATSEKLAPRSRSFREIFVHLFLSFGRS